MSTSQPTLGFKLWSIQARRKFFNGRRKFWNWLFTFNTLVTIASLVLTGFGLYFAITANNIAQKALELSISDKSQQEQINLLGQALKSIQAQNDISNQQLENLVAILDVDKRTEKSNVEKNKALKQSDLVAMSNLFESQIAVFSSRFNKANLEPIASDIDGLTQMHAACKNVLNNEVYLSDLTAKNEWNKLGNELDKVLKFYWAESSNIRDRIGQKDKLYDKMINDLAKTYNSFIIFLPKRLTQLEAEYKASKKD